MTLAPLAFPGKVLAVRFTSLRAGWIADHWEPRRTMVASNSARGLGLNVGGCVVVVALTAQP
ncbi:MAG: hypothetical protein H7338_11370 [Candidatus Sericytochromatia bacterium]|nr:hypothetical protein [Candidatus Sericytochromatia bacterium]